DADDGTGGTDSVAESGKGATGAAADVDGHPARGEVRLGDRGGVRGRVVAEPGVPGRGADGEERPSLGAVPGVLLREPPVEVAYHRPVRVVQVDHDVGAIAPVPAPVVAPGCGADPDRQVPAAGGQVLAPVPAVGDHHGAAAAAAAPAVVAGRTGGAGEPYARASGRARGQGRIGAHLAMMQMRRYWRHRLRVCGPIRSLLIADA